MNPCESPKRGAKLFGLSATILIVCSLAFAGPALADKNQCAPGGAERATALPKDLTPISGVGQDDDNTTPTVEPLSAINVDALGLGTPGVLNVGTLSDAPPSICVDATGTFTGFDNQLLVVDRITLVDSVFLEKVPAPPFCIIEDGRISIVGSDDQCIWGRELS